MFKKIFYCLFVLIFTASSKAFGLAEFQQIITMAYASYLDVRASNQELSTKIINPDTGNISSPSATFQVRANEFLSDYEFNLTAKVLSDSGEVNAYYYDGNKMYLILGNLDNLPQASSINDIKSSNVKYENNPNAIAYPLFSQNYAVFEENIMNNPNFGGVYYSLKTLWFRFIYRQTLEATPMKNTYSISNDSNGVYQAILTFSAVFKP